jgi:tmRNA-binding protein
MSARAVSDSRLISFAEAGEILGGIHANTIRERKAGTHELTHVSGFGRRVFLIRAEVEALLDRKIAQAQADERSRRKSLRLVS